MHVTLVSYIVDEILINFIELKEFVESLSKMAIVETAWEKFLESDSEVPPDVFFLVKGEDEGIGKDSSRTIGAHKNFLAGVSPVFRRMLFGPLKESKDVIEVKDTTFEAFNTMIDYIYKPPSSKPFFPAGPTLHDQIQTILKSQSNLGYLSEATSERSKSDKEHPNRIRCPQKFFDLLNLAEKYELESMKQELSNVLDTLDIRDNNVIFTARVAKSYQHIVSFEEVSIKLLAKCLKFLLKRTGKAGDIWTRFWALVNNSENSEVELRQCISFQEKLFGTPFADLTISHSVLRETLDKFETGTYDECLYLACSGAHVR